MIKKLVQWQGFDGRQASQTCYFNLTRYEIAHDMDLQTLEQRLNRFQDEVLNDLGEDGQGRDMSTSEIREMFDIITVLIKHSYGVRSADGKRFSKNDELWEEFKDTGCFDAFIFQLFEDPTQANAFMTEIWPQEVQDEVAKQAATTLQSVPEAPDDSDVKDLDVGEKPWDAYHVHELVEMGDEEFDALLKRSTHGKNVPFELLQIALRRKSGGSTE